LRNDQAVVAVLARAVAAQGYEVWWDGELPPHRAYGEGITVKVEQARLTIVVWSLRAVQSERGRTEADMARHHPQARPDRDR
jgi:hypothetical protein